VLKSSKKRSLQKLAHGGDGLAGWSRVVARGGRRTVWYEIFVTVGSHRPPATILRELNLGAVDLLVQDLHKQASQQTI